MGRASRSSTPRSSSSRRSQGVRDPEQKRHIIGEEFVRVQERIIESRHLLDGHWILGQGTIYPDTIESGGTAKAAVIKTHHNRVAGIQKLIEAGRIVEPLKSFYKDEVREIGRELGLPRNCSTASVSRAGARHPLPVLRSWTSRAGDGGGLRDPGAFGGRAGRRAQLRAGARVNRSIGRCTCGGSHGTDQPHLGLIAWSQSLRDTRRLPRCACFRAR